MRDEVLRARRNRSPAASVSLGASPSADRGPGAWHRTARARPRSPSAAAPALGRVGQRGRSGCRPAPSRDSAYISARMSAALGGGARLDLGTGQVRDQRELHLLVVERGAEPEFALAPAERARRRAISGARRPLSSALARAASKRARVGGGQLALVRREHVFGDLDDTAILLRRRSWRRPRERAPGRAGGASRRGSAGSFSIRAVADRSRTDHGAKSRAARL